MKNIIPTAVHCIKYFRRLEINLTLCFFIIFSYGLLLLMFYSSFGYRKQTWLAGIYACLVITNSLMEYCLDLVRFASRRSERIMFFGSKHLDFLFGRRRFLPYITVILLLFGIINTLNLNPALSFFIAFIGLLMLPASIALLSITNNVAQSYNPVILFEFIKKFPIDYFAILVLMALSLLTSQHILDADKFPSFVFICLSYFLIFFCAMFMGETLHTHANLLGINSDIHEKQTAAKEKHMKNLMYQLHLYCRGDNITEAIDYLERKINHSEINIDEDIHQYLMSNGDKRLALKHAQKYAQRLIFSQKTQKAWQVVISCFNKFNTFTMLNEHMQLQLINAACTQEQFICSARLLLNFSKDFPASKNKLKSQELLNEICDLRIQNESIRENIRKKIQTQMKP